MNPSVSVILHVQLMQTILLSLQSCQPLLLSLEVMLHPVVLSAEYDHVLGHAQLVQIKGVHTAAHRAIDGDLLLYCSVIQGLQRSVVESGAS